MGSCSKTCQCVALCSVRPSKVTWLLGHSTIFDYTCERTKGVRWCKFNRVNIWWPLKGSSCLMVHWMQQLTWDTARWFSCAHISRKHMSKLGTRAAFMWSVAMCVCNGAKMLQTHCPTNGNPNALSNRQSNKHTWGCTNKHLRCLPSYHLQ